MLTELRLRRRGRFLCSVVNGLGVAAGHGWRRNYGGEGGWWQDHLRGGGRNVRLLAARAYYRSAQLTRARSALEALLGEGADDAYVHLMLGRTLQRQGERVLAEPHLKLAAVMDPALA